MHCIVLNIVLTKGGLQSHPLHNSIRNSYAIPPSFVTICSASPNEAVFHNLPVSPSPHTHWPPSGYYIPTIFHHATWLMSGESACETEYGR